MIVDIPFDSYEPIVFLGKNSYYDFGLHTTEPIVVPHPKRKVTQENVIGKNGSITFDEEAYEDITITAKFAIVADNSTDLISKLDQVKSWLAGGQGQLIIATEPDKYYIAQCIDKFDITPLAEEFGTFPITFNCKPLKKAVEDTLYQILDQNVTRAGSVISPLCSYNFTGGTATANNTAIRIADNKSIKITNDGNQPSLPIISIWGSGDITISIGSQSFTIKGLDDHIIVDSESVNAYRGQTPRNNMMIGDFPILSCGDSVLTWSGNVQEIDLECNSNWI